MRTCPFDDCGAHIPDSMFACRRHWYTLGRTARDEIWAAYNSYMADRLTTDELRAIQSRVLAEAGQKGVEA